MEVFRVELTLKMSQTVEHLDRTLRVSKIKYLVKTSLILDHLDVGNIIIETHVSPGKHPVGIVVFRRKSLMPQRVLRTSIVAYPDIVTLVH